MNKWKNERTNDTFKLQLKLTFVILQPPLYERQWWEQDSMCEDRDQDSEAQNQHQDSEPKTKTVRLAQTCMSK